MAAPIVIIGSSNTDMVIQADHIPLPGETILGGTFFMNPGGKGANQAVAAARLGGTVTFICKIGDDVFGRRAIEGFREEGIQTQFIIVDTHHPSGVALITVDRQGENCIVVAPGANNELSFHDLKQAEQTIEQASFILMQLEIPVSTAEYVLALAHQKVKIILNPAPAYELTDQVLKMVDIITPNELEAEKLTGIKIENGKSAERAARALHEKGVETVIITRGSEGALLLHENRLIHVKGHQVKAIDTTGAGDIFNGALVVGLSEAMKMEDAVAFACSAASISVTRLGAQASAPFKHEMYVQS